MSDIGKRAAEALELLPEQMPEQMPEAAVSHLYEQGEKFRHLKELVQDGIDDVAAGRVSERDFDAVLKDVRALNA